MMMVTTPKTPPTICSNATFSLSNFHAIKIETPGHKQIKAVITAAEPLW